MESIHPLLARWSTRGGDQTHLGHRYEARRRIFQYIILLVSIILTATQAILEESLPADPEPYHTSALTGAEWVIELILGHPGRIHCELGVHADVFKALVAKLRELGHGDSGDVSLEEQLAIFLYTCVTGSTIRHVGERFQRSNDTISRYFREILYTFAAPPFYTTYVHFPDPSYIHPKIRNNPKFWPYFKDAIGALDGTHIHAYLPPRDRPSYRNRKGFVSQNCLFACNFDLSFVYAQTGWDGSVSDARLFHEACPGDLEIPSGKYFLADAGFPLCDNLLVPYRGVRYRFAEWGRVAVRPINKGELFNLRHASARNVVERIFGVLKRRFRILLLSPEYSIDIQARIPAALCALHNFIRIHDPDEGPLPADGVDGDPTYYQDSESDLPIEQREDADSPVPVHNRQAAVEARDCIAQKMWDDYQDILHQRGSSDSDFTDFDEDSWSSGDDGNSESNI